MSPNKVPNTLDSRPLGLLNLKTFSKEYKEYEIDHERRRLIEKTYEELFLSSMAYRRYKASKEDVSFQDFRKNQLKKLRKGLGKIPLISVFSGTGQAPPFDHLIILMSNPGDIPPTEPGDILDHLKALWTWEIMKLFQLVQDYTTERALSLALTKLSQQISALIKQQENYARREWTRTKKTTEAKRKIAEQRKSFVLAIYEHGKPIALGTKFSEVVRIIQTQFNNFKGAKDAPWGEIPKNMKTPSRDAIEEWFREEGIFTKDFEKKGVTGLSVRNMRRNF